jgi:hypothetical protein
MFPSYDGTNSIGTLAIGTALMANLARNLTEQIIVCQNTAETAE